MKRTRRDLVRREALVRFAELTLAQMQADQDWGSDTMQEIAGFAFNLKLAYSGRDSMFRVEHERLQS
jgi:hypothetical protein